MTSLVETAPPPAGMATAAAHELAQDEKGEDGKWLLRQCGALTATGQVAAKVTATHVARVPIRKCAEPAVAQVFSLRPVRVADRYSATAADRYAC